ncbi:MAG: lytic transglycosylase domain-containing protein [Gammaproteobacteria bacterium]|nr:lytic transglycosylase domain-containing protein [Gammaproteobacteria bacterium]
MEVELNEEAENEGQETTEEGPAERAEGEAAEDTGVTTPTEGETGGNADLSGAFETLEKQGAGLSDIQKQILENEIKAAPKTTLTTPDTGEFTPEAESGAVESEDTGESGESQIKKYAPTNVEDAEVIDKAIDTNAKANGLDPDFVAAVIQAESSFKKDAVSYAGAEGLMQMLPGTAKDMGVSDSKDPEDNIKGGTKYLAKIMEMMKKAGKEPLIDWVLAGYNAGPYGAVKWTTIPNDIRTQYIDKIKMEMRRLKESS